ncbi:TOMM precursor leader peptide-binding protein, partial [Streptomyces anulatus]|uniref:TOMM precursor leader peptide-binding protein n=1 Tax=Streptomyces anulatus TaxID=1892 RepID=UPI0036645762
MAENPTSVVCAPALSDDAGTEWGAVLEPLGASGDGTVGANLGWDLDWEREQLRSAGGREHLSVRVYGDEVLVGPRWVPGTDSGCAGCAELRSRLVIDHPLTDDLSRPTSRVAPRRPFLPELIRAALARLADRPLGPGELYAVGARGTRTHRVPRHFACPLCAPEIPEQPVGRPPGPLALRSRPAAADNPGRAAAGAGLVRPGALRSRLVDPRFGPVLAQQRELLAPFAMSMALQPDAVALGYARETTFAKADPIAILEVYERLSGFPHQAPLVEGVSYAELVSAEGGAEVAIRPAAFGEYTEEQAARPTARIERVTDDTPMDWAWGHDLADGRPRLVPAELAFFQYDYRYGRQQRAARPGGAPPRPARLNEGTPRGCGGDRGGVGAGVSDG